MTNNEYETIRKIIDPDPLDDKGQEDLTQLEDLTDISIRHEVQLLKDAQELSRWLPRGATRKMVMVVIVLTAFTGGFVYGRGLFYSFLLILPIFSPRIIGRAFILSGKISRNSITKKVVNRLT